ncbi:nitrate reductase [Saccharospirillum salsuginis]|uniref:Nitrate reductase n=1 Tax=Saccharospirillum salsuginis TaxID=418750 RepID=A0A918KF00_9GAMM|nr:nitrate reductase [Saccharospirillum salsuginis]GGX59256.1 nitrate reductase [Saccharospirillum salsuginis]
MSAVHTTCAYCGVGCGVEVPGRGDRSVRVKGLASHPANGGRLCVKGTHLGDTLPLKDRLLYPSIDGRDTDWDTAVELIAGRLQVALDEYGPDSIGFYLSGQLLTEDYYVANKLAKGFLGTANVDTNSRLCMSSAVAAHTRAFGEDLVPGNYDDLEQADLVVLVGSNLAWAHPVLFQRLQNARQHNPHKQLIVIDPRRTETAEAADLHLPLKPGTDGRLLNGLLAWLADRNQIDRAYIDTHTQGFDDTLAQAREHAGTDLPQLAEDCGLRLADVQSFFNTFAATEKTVTAWSMGINQSRSGVDKSQTIINLHLATGRIGKPGAAPFSITGQPNAMGGREVGGLANQLAAHRDFAPENVDAVEQFWQAKRMARQPGLKAVDLFRAAAEGRIKVLWILATNPLASMPDAPLVKKALERVETVIVSDVVQHTDTVAYADIVLPALAWGEKDGTVTNSERCLSRQRGFLIPPGQAKPDWWALARVGQSLGHTEAFAYERAADVFREHARLSTLNTDSHRQFNLTGLDSLTPADYDNLQPVQWPLSDDGEPTPRLFSDGRFATPDGKARFIPVTPEEPTESTDRLRLNTGRIRDQWHSMTRTGFAPRLTQHRRDFTLAMHPIDADRLGIAADALVRVHNEQGRFLARADLTDTVQPGQLFAPMHWNQTFASEGGVAQVIPPKVDPLAGQPESKHALVDVEPVPIAVHGLYVGFNLPTPLLDGAHWFKHHLNGMTVWQLFYTDATVTDLRQRLNLDATDLILSDDHDHWFQAISRPPTNNPHWLSLSEHPIAEPDTDWLEQQFDQGNDSMDDWVRGQPAGDLDRGKLVCTCFNVRDKQIAEYLEENTEAGLEDVQQALKCSTSCGSCLTEVVKIVETSVTTPG